MSRKTYI